MPKRRLRSPRLPVPSSPILVVGDIMCDHYVWGDVERISPEAPVQVLRWDNEANRPGGAANAAMNLAALGCKVHIIGIVGSDEAGHWLLETLRGSGIDTRDVIVSRTRTTTLKTRVIARGQHMLRIDRETRAVPDLAEERRIVTAIGKLKRLSGIVCSDYAKGVLTAPVLAASLSVPGRPFVLIDPKGRDFLKYRGADLLTPNERELMEAVGNDQLPATGRRLPAEEEVIRDRAHTLMRRLDLKALLVTRGAGGMDLFETEGRTIRRTHIDALQRQEVFDVTGAGDTVAAVLMLGAAAGLPLVEAARVANAAAGLVVGMVGTAVVDPDALLRVIGRHGRAVPY
jgi:rfaE bifunctional protein kinase chain/domain